MFFTKGLRNVLFTLVIGTLWVDATQVMHRPADYKDAPHQYEQGKSVPRIIHKRSGAKVNMAYFTNWYTLRLLSLRLV